MIEEKNSVIHFTNYLGCRDLDFRSSESRASHQLLPEFKTTSAEIQKNYKSHKALHVEDLWSESSVAVHARWR